MHQALQGLTVLITGAGRGIGQGIAFACAKRGARVAATALTLDEAKTTADEIAEAGGAATALVCDVTCRESVDAAITGAAERFGRLDCVVHNATSRFSPISTRIEEIEEEAWDDLVAVSLRGSYLLARAALPYLRSSGGSLLILTSNAAYHGAQDLPAYAAVKGAQRGLVKALAREWGPDGVRVNALSPLAMTPAMERYLDLYPEAREPLLDRAALHRFGAPEADIGAAATMFIGPDARFVTGQTLIVDGGGVMP